MPNKLSISPKCMNWNETSPRGVKTSNESKKLLCTSAGHGTSQLDSLQDISWAKRVAHLNYCSLQQIGSIFTQLSENDWAKSAWQYLFNTLESLAAIDRAAKISTPSSLKTISFLASNRLQSVLSMQLHCKVIVREKDRKQPDHLNSPKKPHVSLQEGGIAAPLRTKGTAWPSSYPSCWARRQS